MTDAAQTQATQTDPHPIRLLVACTAAWTIGTLSYMALPQLLEPIKDAFGMGDEVVTRLYGYELLVFAVAALAVAGPLARMSRVKIAMTGGTLMILGCVYSAITADYDVLVVCRLVAGLGGAMVVASGTAAAASSARPARAFAIITITSNLLLAAEPAVLEWLAFGPYGLKGGFLALAIITAALMPVMIWLIPPRKEDQPGASKSIWNAMQQAPNRALALAAMVALFIYETGQGGIWTYMAEIGTRSGLADQGVANGLSMGALVGLLGALLAIWMGERFGNKWPIVLGIGINVIAAVLLAYSSSPEQFVALTAVWYGAYYFVIPYVLGLMAQLDKLGRWAVAADAMWWMGDAAGPPVAGMIMERSGMELLALFPACTGAICIAIFLGLLRRLREQSA